MIALLFFWLGWMSAPRGIRIEMAAPEAVLSAIPYTWLDCLQLVIALAYSAGVAVGLTLFLICGILYLIERLK